MFIRNNIVLQLILPCIPTLAYHRALAILVAVCQFSWAGLNDGLSQKRWTFVTLPSFGTYVISQVSAARCKLLPLG